MPDAETTWGWVADERRALAERLGALPADAWDRPSLCAGWRVRDVVGHLVWLAEATRRSALTDALRQAPRPVGAAVTRLARQVGAGPAEELVDRLRAGADGRFVLPGLGPAVALGEVLAHGSDALRGAGATVRPADERTRDAAAACRRVAAGYGNRAATKVRFTATDAGWSVGPEDGPAADGPGEAVLLAIVGRPEGVAELRGPGVDLLSR